MRSDSSNFHLRFDLGPFPFYYGFMSYICSTFLCGGMQPGLRLFDIIELLMPPKISPAAFLDGTLYGGVNLRHIKYGALLSRIFNRFLQSVGVKTRSTPARADSGSIWGLTYRQRIAFFLYLLDLGRRLSPLE